jgi:hypothetical protein
MTSNVLPTILREMGYIEGQNLVIESRFADGKLDRLSSLASELVQLRVEALVAASQPAVKPVGGAHAPTGEPGGARATAATRD